MSQIAYSRAVEILPKLENFLEGDPDYDDANLIDSFVEYFRIMVKEENPHSPNFEEIVEEHMDFEWYVDEINETLKKAVEIWRDWRRED